MLSKRFNWKIAVWAVVALFLIVVGLSLFNGVKPVKADTTRSIDDSFIYAVIKNDETLVQKKIELANKYSDNAESMTSKQRMNRSDMIDAILGDNSIKDKQEILAQNGVYQLEIPEENVVLSASNADDVLLKKISIYYDSKATEWILSSSNNVWVDKNAMAQDLDLGALFMPNIGDLHPIGSPDYLGVLLSDTYYEDGAKPTVSYKSGYALFTGGSAYADQADRKTTSRSALVSSGSGVIYALQDYKVVTDVKLPYVLWCNDYAVMYTAETFETVVHYDQNFEFYHGNAVVFYAHTWQDTNTSITGIGIGKNSISVSWNTASTAYRWDKITIDYPF